MIIDHTHPLYREKRKKLAPGSQYNGAYYYSRDICRYIIPNVETNRNWVTVRLPEAQVELDHSIVFIHNNRNPNYYKYLKDYNDLILVCGVPETVENMNYFGRAIYLPLSLNIKSVERYKKKHKTKDMAFAGRRVKINNRVPSNCDILTDMPQGELIKRMSDYETIYSVGRTAIQARILGAKIGVYDPKYPDPKLWTPLDCLDAAKMLQKMLDKIDRS